MMNCNGRLFTAWIGYNQGRHDKQEIVYHYVDFVQRHVLRARYLQQVRVLVSLKNSRYNVGLTNKKEAHISLFRPSRTANRNSCSSCRGCGT